MKAIRTREPAGISGLVYEEAPDPVDHVHAAAVPRAGLTAWQALFDHGRLAKGQTVVIHGAGGAVGSTTAHLRPQVGGVYPLADAVRAYTAKAADGIAGRIVLQP